MGFLLEISPFINTVLLFWIIIFVLWNSSSWKGPKLAARLDKVERTILILVGNFQRLDRDVSAWRKDAVDTSEALSHKLEEAVAVSREFSELRDKVTNLENQVTKMDQVTTALPCNPCGREKI